MTSKRLLTLVMALIAIMWGVDRTFSADKPKPKKLQQITAADRKAAAKRAAQKGLRPGVAGRSARSAARTGAPGALVALPGLAAPLPGTEGPGGVPHYFGPYGNWAYSPLPKGPVVTVSVVDAGTGYIAPEVYIDDAYGTATVQATATATFDATTGAITGFTIVGGGADYSAPVVTILDPTGTGATADAVIGGTLTGGMRKFVDTLPLLGPAGANNLSQYIPVATAQGWPIGCAVDACTADYYEIGLVEFTEKMHSDLPPTRLRGYVQLSATGAHSLVNPDGTAINMPNGVQAKSVEPPHYLGPVIVAKGRAHGVAGAAGAPRPVRIKFYNLLPAGAGGNLFLPVDETVPGSGEGPIAGQKYSQNRATIHLHGNNTVWISDGNTHQWITPAGEATPYPKGVSARNVPDMGTDCDAGNRNPVVAGNSGCQTFFYTNAQSARLQFYHDHALGITRLNVYAGEAAGYVLTDAVEQDMIAGTNVSGVNPTGLKVLPDIGIPLVIQDRTWVDPETVFAQDPTWNWGTGPRDANGNLTAGGPGDLWFPHVYMSAQNPWDLGGVNAVGRWHYGAWFNPPIPECLNGGPVGCIAVGPVPNEYYDPINAPWEPPMRPGVPNPSIPGEGFMDTPTVNGTAYPVLKVEPKAYRFRVLSAANDRMFNLQLYVAADKNSWTPGTGSAAPGTPMTLCDPTPADPTVCTEVKMVSVNGAPNQYADWPSGIPDPTTAGPDWIQIGTEGGLMPKPVVLPQQPVGWNLNPTTFNFGTVNQHSLLLGSAERADVVVDFSAYAGKTLILYNDAPAAFPAGVPAYDYFTGVANQMDVGGAPTTLPGYGPNTRTIMQIQVGTTVTTPTTDVTLANLEAVFAKTATKRGVFEMSQEPIIIPQAEYNSAYNNTFPTTAAEQYVQIAETAKTFRPIDVNGVLQTATTLPLEMKAMHDEMGGVYDTQFGRMSGMLGLSNPLAPRGFLLPYGYAAPPTDLVMGSPEATPVGVMPDGTQIWRIFHNGVDTHTIHTHLFHAQLINRLGQDGLNLGVDPIELGWKDTFRVNPLEITYLAMRPTVPTPDLLPFEAPDSIRLIDPTLPNGADLVPPPPAGWFTPAGTSIARIRNHVVNFGWEYVWHCHILAHEEMDMMHSLVFAVPPSAPTGLTGVVTYPNPNNLNNPRVDLTWTDTSFKELQFTVERATDENFTTGLRTWNRVNTNPAVPSPVTFSDTTVARNGSYWYRVWAIGRTVGDSQTAGFPTLSANTVSSTVAIQLGTTPVPPAPTNLLAAAAAGPVVNLRWTDNALNETGFVVERCSGVDCGSLATNFAQIAALGQRGFRGVMTYVDSAVTIGGNYQYQVKAMNGTASSVYSNVATAGVPDIPFAPASLTVLATKVGTTYTATLTWTLSTGAPPATFTIQRSTSARFTTGLSTTSVGGALLQTTQTVNPNTTYYYRIRANNIGGMSTWKNASPFPMRTGP